MIEIDSAGNILACILEDKKISAAYIKKNLKMFFALDKIGRSIIHALIF